MFKDEIVCLSPETVIRTEKGGVKIENISPGMSILTINPETRDIKSEVTEVNVSSVHKSIVAIEFENGMVLKCTKDHPI